MQKRKMLTKRSPALIATTTTLALKACTAGCRRRGMIQKGALPHPQCSNGTQQTWHGWYVTVTLIFTVYHYNYYYGTPDLLNSKFRGHVH